MKRKSTKKNNLKDSNIDGKSLASLGMISKGNISSIVHFDEPVNDSDLGTKLDHIVQKKSSSITSTMNKSNG